MKKKSVILLLVIGLIIYKLIYKNTIKNSDIKLSLIV